MKNIFFMLILDVTIVMVPINQRVACLKTANVTTVIK